MNARRWWMLAAVAGAAGLAAVMIARLRDHARLGEPGVMVVHEPIYGEKQQIAGEQSVRLPSELAQYQSAPSAITDIELSWLPKDTTYGRRTYQRQYGARDTFEAMMSVVLMGTDRGSIHKPQICLVGQGWTIDQSEVVEIPIQEPHPYRLAVMKLLASRAYRDAHGGAQRARAIYVYWFVADGELTPYHGERMWWMARDMIFRGVLQRWAYVSCQAICMPGHEGVTFARMSELIAAAVPKFQKAGQAGRMAAGQGIWERGSRFSVLGCWFLGRHSPIGWATGQSVAVGWRKSRLGGGIESNWRARTKCPRYEGVRTRGVAGRREA